MESVAEPTISDNTNGYIRSKEARQRMSKAQMGKHLSNKTKLKISKALLGANNPFYGKHHTNETLHKISETNKGNKYWLEKHHTKKSKFKISLAKNGQPSPMKGRHQTEEAKKQMSLHHIGKHLSNSSRMKISRSNMKNNVKRVERINEHNDAIDEEAINLQSQGFKTFVTNRIIPDIITKKEEKLYAVEIEFGKPNYEKYLNQQIFDDILWIMKKHKK